MDADELAGIAAMLEHALTAAEQSRGRVSAVEFQRLVEHADKLADMFDDAARQNSNALTESRRADRDAAQVKLLSLKRLANRSDVPPD